MAWKHKRVTASVGVLGTLAAIAVGSTALPSGAANRPTTHANTSTHHSTPTGANTASTNKVILPNGVALGSSFGGSSTTNIKQTVAKFPNSSVGRYYFPGNPSTYSSSNLPAIPSSQIIMVSFKTSVTTVKSGAYDATFASILRSWNASGRTIYWTWQHEADNPSKHIKAADYVAGWKRLLAVAAANKSPKVHSMSILMAYVLSPRHPHGDPAAWYVNTDVIGFDCYSLVNEKLAIAYAASKGKRLAFPEFGAGLTGMSDPASTAFAQSFIKALTPNVFAAAWYNALGTVLSRIPQTQRYLNSIA